MIPVLVILLIWVALVALMLGMFHVGSGTPTPRPAPHRLRTSDTVELGDDRRKSHKQVDRRRREVPLDQVRNWWGGLVGTGQPI